jgi:hypothetical protein
LVDLAYGAFGEVAAVGGLPIVVLFGQDGTDETDHRGVVGEDADYVGAPFDLFVDSFEGLVEALLRQWALGKVT